MDRRQFLLRTGSVAACLGPLSAFGVPRAVAQTAYPNRSVTIAVPFSGGSMTDILARTIAQKLGSKWGQTVIVENRPGIGGTAGIVKSPADGYTLMLTSNGHTVIKAVNTGITFDPIADFAAISKVATMPIIMIVPKDSPAKTLREFIDMARQAPGGLNFASAGRGSSTGLAAELLRKTLDTKMTMVAFRGLPESNTAVLRGDAAFAFTFFNVGGDLIQNGELRALAVTGDARLPMLPNVPTFKEAGLPNFNYEAWFGLLAPAGVPADVMARVNADVREALSAADLRATFAPQSVSLTPSTPSEFASQIATDSKRYSDLFTSGAN